MSERLKVAVISHGESGSAMIQALAASGANVVAFNPVTTATPAATPGAAIAGSIEEAVTEADVVFSLNLPAVAHKVAADSAPLLAEGALYADLNPGTPAMKKELAALFHQGAFVDVVLTTQATGPTSDLSLEMSGTGARRLREVLSPSGFTLDYISEVPGEAAARALFRSLLAKSVVAAVVDSLWAAESLGIKDWAHQEVLQTFEAGSAQSVQDGLVDTARNFKRRQMELMEILAALRDTGYDSSLAAPIDYMYGSLMHGKKIPGIKLR